jgi:hypothetical protein
MSESYYVPTPEEELLHNYSKSLNEFLHYGVSDNIYTETIFKEKKSTIIYGHLIELQKKVINILTKYKNNLIPEHIQSRKFSEKEIINEGKRNFTIPNSIYYSQSQLFDKSTKEPSINWNRVTLIECNRGYDINKNKTCDTYTENKSLREQAFNNIKTIQQYLQDYN